MSFLDKKYGSEILLKENPNVSEEYMDEDSTIKFDKRIAHNSSCKPSEAMDEALELIDQ